MKRYTCPMHPEVKSRQPGKCPKCGMNLTKLENGANNHKEHDSMGSYAPLFVIISLIALVSFTISVTTGLSTKSIISNFMIGFFITFAGFKLLDLKGFAQGYSTYDLLAQKWFGYGYVYPFIELLFGLSMIINFLPTQILIAEILVMGFSGLGVAIKMAKKEKFQCACLGTFLKVPLTKITLIEDFGMAILALVLLLST